MIHKAIFDDIGLFDESLPACEDYDLWLRILLNYELGLIKEQLTTKIAGHKGQLSFETPLIDTYRVKALKKHLDSKYHYEVKTELIKKINIILKGAKKHNNQTNIKLYSKYLASLT